MPGKFLNKLLSRQKSKLHPTSVYFESLTLSLVCTLKFLHTLSKSLGRHAQCLEKVVLKTIIVI